MSFGEALQMAFSTRSAAKVIGGPGLGWFGIGSSSSEGTVANYKTAFALSAFYNGVDQISNDIAKLPKSVKRKIGKNREDYSEHPVNYLISDYPNQMMTSFDFWKLIIVSMIIKGNGYAEIIRGQNTGRTISFIHRDSDDVTVYEKDDQLIYKFKGREIASDNMLHFKAFSFDGKIGVSIIQFAAKQLGVSLDAQEYQSTVYTDRGMGYGVIESDISVDPDTKKLIEAGFSTKMAQKNKFNVPMLDEGMKYKSISVSPAEAQFLESNKNGVLEVCRWLNIAPHKLKVLDNSNNANIQHQSIEHVQDSILRYIIPCEQELKHKLFALKERLSLYVKFNEKVLLRGDLEARKNYYTALVYAGVMTRNEVRALEDMNPLDGLDEILQPVNMQALSLATQLIEQQIKDKGNGS